jgi:hypothetical protein
VGRQTWDALVLALGPSKVVPPAVRTEHVHLQQDLTQGFPSGRFADGTRYPLSHEEYRSIMGRIAAANP